jgi:hypothetical protein
MILRSQDKGTRRRLMLRTRAEMQPLLPHNMVHTGDGRRTETTTLASYSTLLKHVVPLSSLAFATSHEFGLGLRRAVSVLP